MSFMNSGASGAGENTNLARSDSAFCPSQVTASNRMLSSIEGQKVEPIAFYTFSSVAFAAIVINMAISEKHLL